MSNTNNNPQNLKAKIGQKIKVNKNFNISKDEALNLSVIRQGESAMSFLQKFSDLYNYNRTLAEH
jgi:hypothetical protein